MDLPEVITNNILIPEGLLQGENNGVYARLAYDTGNEGANIQALSRIIRRPTQAVVASHRASKRSRSLQYPFARNLSQDAPAFGGTFGPRSSGQRPFSPRRKRPSRAASINVATLLRRKRSDRQTSPVALYKPREADDLEELKAKGLRQSTSIEGNGLQNGHSPYDNTHSVCQISRSWSPTLRPGRLSIYSPEESPHHRRQVSFVLGSDLITVRRPTAIPVSVNAPFPPGPGKSISDVPTPKTNYRSRQSSIRNTFERAKSRQQRLQRSEAFQWFFQYSMYLLILAFVYLVLVGRPLWGGTVWYIYLLFEYHLTFVGGSAIFVGLAFFYAFAPLLTVFEKSAVLPMPAKPYFPPASFIRCFEEEKVRPPEESAPDNASMTALLIPCYKSASLLPATLEAALKVFPATSIYILANGNSATPLDNTEEVCTQFGVNHIWIPIGSKIVAQFVGAHVVRQSFPYVLLIDDDCLLPPNFPVVIDRLHGHVKCLGYTLTSIGANRSRGTWCQQAQDLEYKLSGLQRAFAGKIGSATFPHGAIVLWDTEFLIRTFKEHPGFSVSEDWFFGHVARILGSRISMCSSVFVETETPSSVFFAARGGARGGFGEMTVFKQRFKRWNFFFVNGCYYNIAYILFSWRLGFWEIGAKLFVFQEVYETALYLITPLVLPISFLVRPAYTAYLFIGTLALYLLNSVIFNEIHLRRANQMVSRRMVYCYYMPFKLALTFVNVSSCWWSLWQYAKYFAKKHPRIVDDVEAVGVVLKIEEQSDIGETREVGHISDDKTSSGVRRAGAKRGHRLQKRRPDEALRRPDSQLSTSQHSGDSAKYQRRPRRLTVTAVKVDIVQDHRPESAQSETTQYGRSSPTTRERVAGLSRTQSMSGGIFGQLNDWSPSWTYPVFEQTGSEHDGVDVMEQVDEEEEEDSGLGGYTYYGI